MTLLRERLAAMRHALTKQSLDLDAARRHARRAWAVEVLRTGLPAPIPVPGIFR